MWRAEEQIDHKQHGGSADAVVSLQERHASGSRRPVLEVQGYPSQVEEIVTGINATGAYDIALIAEVSSFERAAQPGAAVVGPQTITIYMGDARLADTKSSVGFDPARVFVHELAHTYRGILRLEDWVRRTLCQKRVGSNQEERCSGIC